MDMKSKESVVIKFLTKEGCGSEKIHNHLMNIYGDAVMDISNVWRCVEKFENRETEISDKSRSGRPRQISATDANRECTDEFIGGTKRVWNVCGAVKVSS